jgi:hypothetical protein
MRGTAHFSAVLVIVALLIPTWGQDTKQDQKKDAKLDRDKKSATEKQNTTEKRNGEKKTKTAKAKNKAKSSQDESPPEEKVEYADVLAGEIRQIDPNTLREFTITVTQVDPRKVADLNIYKQQQVLRQQRQVLDIQQAGNLVDRQTAMLRFQNSEASYQLELVRRQGDLTMSQDVELRAAENIKVRTAFPPREYDDKGNMKVWKEKELKNLRKGSKLPGYPAEFGALRPKQGVVVYLAKPPPTLTKSPAKKGNRFEGIKLEAPTKTQEADPISLRPEVVMIVILQEPLPGQR